MYPRRFRKRFVRKHFNNGFQIFSYIQNLSVDLIETLKTTIYNTKQTQNSKLHVRHLYLFQQKAYLSKKDIRDFSVYAGFYRTLYIIYISTMLIVEGHTT